MTLAAKPHNEKERLAALEEYHILDTLPEQDFDAIIKIASEICHTPISLISIVDKDRQWFKAKNGLEVDETPRDVSFCAHAILQPDVPMVINDAREDNRFFDNPLTVGAPNVIFYAGVPLVTPEGYPLGTLCVIDNQPKTLTEEQLVALRALASQVMGQFELRKKALELERISDDLERKNRELWEAKEELEEALKAKSTFLSMMSHEIRTPLHAILGNINLLLEESPRPDQEAPLSVLKFTGETLLSIINDILDYSKLEANKVQLEKIPFNIRDLIANIVSINAHRARERGNAIKVEIADDVPSYLSGDPTRLVQVINNLVSNAVKFTKKGSVTIKISIIEYGETFDKLLFEIIDTGIGIPKEALDNIFEEFAQASSVTTRQFGGTGLGLAIIRKLLRLFNSNIQVKSEVGQGSNFYFTIQSPKVLAPHTRKTIETEYDFKGFDVLAVDDNEINLRIISKNLEKKGVSVQTFFSPIEALASVRSGTKYDLVIVDLQMPEMNGFELAAEIRKVLPHVPIIASSADSNNETLELALQSGMNDYLLKPHTPNDMYILLAKHLLFKNEDVEG